MREFGTCKGCGAEIEWALLNGKPHPFEIDPSGAKAGTHELVDKEGRTHAVYHAREARKSGQRLVKSHFAVCSKAADFRKAGR